MRILVLDNDSAFLRSLEILLRRKGHEVICFASPIDALAAVRDGLRPEAFLVDLAMPDMPGDKWIRCARPEVRGAWVIVVSGHSDLAETLDLDALGAHGYLPKPLDLDELDNLLSNLQTGKT